EGRPRPQRAGLTARPQGRGRDTGDAPPLLDAAGRTPSDHGKTARSTGGTNAPSGRDGQAPPWARYAQPGRGASHETAVDVTDNWDGNTVSGSVYSLTASAKCDRQSQRVPGVGPPHPGSAG